jgi:RNA polymerase sigma-70 factor (ECF subfamily)
MVAREGLPMDATGGAVQPRPVPTSADSSSDGVRSYDGAGDGAGVRGRDRRRSGGPALGPRQAAASAGHAGTGREPALGDPLAAALGRDLDGAFERFVQHYQHRLYAFVLTLVKNHSEAEEIAQDAFVSAYGALRGYDPARRRALALRAWLFTIALNKVRNRARRAPALPFADGFDVAADGSDDPHLRAERREAAAALWRALDALAPRYRMPVVLRHVQGLSYDEISRVLHQPVGTAKANVHRGLALLRKSDQSGAFA